MILVKTNQSCLRVERHTFISWIDTKFCLVLQLEHLHTGILVHQFAYVINVLEKFNLDKAYSARTPMVVYVLEKGKYPFRSKEE
jgi:hypothetical protein